VLALRKKCSRPIRTRFGTALLGPASRRAHVVRGKTAPVRAWSVPRDQARGHAPPGMSPWLLAPRRTGLHCHAVCRMRHGYAFAGCRPRYRRFRCTRARRTPRPLSLLFLSFLSVFLHLAIPPSPLSSTTTTTTTSSSQASTSESQDKRSEQCLSNAL
jgi:hypothetical protein